MAGVEHLERMGRELKCPICLSLLRSAVSLVCNHVFCSACISKSMKSASNCPVCKVPYHRREIRPSPHMDNLVTIYKSMEVASGVNIFVTQKEPVNKSPGTEKKRQSTSKQKKVSKNKEEIAETIVANPSKKRVCVMPYPISETPLKSEQLPKYVDPKFAWQTSGDLVNVTGDKTTNTATASKEKVPVDEKREPTFNPFFCLREDVDEDEASERLSAQQSEDVPPQDALCFSDIKDTDDGNPAMMTPVSKSHAERTFDSDLFEWTQRACSPELCFTPIRSQHTRDEHGLGKAWEKEHETAPLDGFPDSNEMLLLKGVKRQMDDQANGNSSNCQSNDPRKKITKRKQRANLTSQGKIVKRLVGVRRKTFLDAASPNGKSKHSETVINPCSGDVKHQNKVSSSQKDKNIGRMLNSQMRLKHMRMHTNMAQDHATVEALEQVPSESAQTKSYDVQIHNEVIPYQKSETDKSHSARGMRKWNTRAQSRVRESKMPFDDAIGKTLEGASPKSSEDQIAFPVSKSCTTERNEVLDSINGGGRWNIKDCTMQQKKPETELRGQNQMADHANTCVTTANVTRSYKTTDSGNEVNEKAEMMKQNKKKRKLNMERKVADQINELGIVEDSEDTSLSPMTSFENRNSGTTFSLQQNGKGDAAKRSSLTMEMVHASANHSSRKCYNVSFPTKCVFCRMEKETEVTGDLMHYFNGKPVAADYNGGNNVIHSHKHCAEWAPNVYFRDGSAVNLASEVARSKRIKCSCCGIKGAALGCFETSCRKSFHYTCAKLIQQCRWDTENFVMLCPLHPQSKLPSEIPESHQRQTPSTSKRECQAQETIKSQTSVRQLWKWPSGSPFKCVICCSALSTAEKEIVSEFAKVSGASVSKTWSPTVTHIIASTDENGACKRTLKFLMAILEGKWILKIDWVKASVKAGAPQGEEQYEIKLDVHGTRDGPRLGRLRAIKQEPKIFNGFKFFFSGDFTPTYRGYLHDLVIAAGGTVLQRKPISREKEKLDDASVSHFFVIYSLELNEKCNPNRGSLILNRRRAEAEATADASGAKVATNTWILDSVAGCKVQSLDKC